MNGDPEAFKKLKLTKEEKDKLLKQQSQKDLLSSPKKKLNSKELLNEIEKAKQKNGGKISKPELMALLLKSDLTPEEMKRIAKENGIKLSKDDLKLLSKMKK